MSTGFLKSGEFPPLNVETQRIVIRGKKKTFVQAPEEEESSSNNMPKMSPNSSSESHSSDYIKVGIQLNDFEEFLEPTLKHALNSGAGFILAPIQPIRTVTERFDGGIYCNTVVPLDRWSSLVFLDLGHCRLDNYNPKGFKYLKQQLELAVCWGCSAIIMDCPDTDLGQISLAQIINEYTKDPSGLKSDPLVVIRCQLHEDKPTCDTFIGPPGVNDEKQPKEKLGEKLPNQNVDIKNCKSNGIVRKLKLGSPSANWLHDLSEDDIYQFDGAHTESVSWRKWNNLRSHLAPYSKLGVCLDINDELPYNDGEIARWAGEPIRCIVIHTDHFVRSPDCPDSVRLSGPYKEFIRTLMLKNSMKPDIILRGRADENLQVFLDYLNNYTVNLYNMSRDDLRAWNDKMQIPLQPLSMNLDNGAYQVFEMDDIKYIKYKDAMYIALQRLLSDNIKNRKQFNLMVLGAGRGPLVHCFIRCLESMAPQLSGKKFKIFALDKNPGAVRLLMYRHLHEWNHQPHLYETQVISCDMRTWEPGVKADIIATELLGSLADNELSPECLDGVWRFSTAKTISIPQSYKSHVQPICSFKAHQEIVKLGYDLPHDRIWVSRLTNFYPISESQELFHFEHHDLSLPPKERCNERYKVLEFESKMDTTCYGFAGYFSSHLFGNIVISTLPETKTPNMDSWFPVFIPIEPAMYLPKGTKLKVHFWRRDSPTQVWYEWAITSPIRTRIYSAGGSKTAMSKFIN